MPTNLLSSIHTLLCVHMHMTKKSRLSIIHPWNTNIFMYKLLLITGSCTFVIHLRQNVLVVISHKQWNFLLVLAECFLICFWQFFCGCPFTQINSVIFMWKTNKDVGLFHKCGFGIADNNRKGWSHYTKTIPYENLT